MKLPTGNIALRITGLYVVFGAAWLLFSDHLLGWLIRNPLLLARLQTAKGYVFIAVTAFFLCGFLSRHLRAINKEHAARLFEKSRRQEMAYRLERYLALAPAVIFTLRIKERSTSTAWVSRSIENILGYTTEEAMAPGWWKNNIHPEDRPKTFADQPLLLEKGSLKHEYRFRRKDGETIWIRDEMRLAAGESGPEAIGTWTDITESRQREENLRKNEEKLQALYDFSLHTRSVSRTSDFLAVMLKEICRLTSSENSFIVLRSSSRGRCVAAGEGFFKNISGESFPYEQYMGDVYPSGKRFYASPDYASDAPGFFPEVKEKMGSTVFITLRTEAEQIVGGLVVSRHRGHKSPPFSDKDIDLLLAIGDLAGNTLRRLDLFETVQEKLRHTQALRNIDMAITGSLDLRVTLRVILDEVTRQIGMDAASILRFNPHLQALTYEAWRGFNAVDPRSFTWALGEGYAGQAARERQSVCCDGREENRADPQQARLMKEEGFVFYYAVPLVAKGLTQGVLEVFSRTPLEGNREDWEEFLETLAVQASVAIDSAELFHNLERSNQKLIQAYDSTLEGWAYALDLKNDETEAHSRRVTEMTMRVAKDMGVSTEDLVHIRRGALLHDIGKMGVPDKILLKPGKLDEEERSVMKKHTDYAFKFLSHIDYLRPAIDIPYCHHERWDGTGYPRGLKGEQIPRAARIFAVVDVWDAISSDRPYHKARSQEKTLDHIRQQAGKHFDPAVVEAFLKVLKKNGA